MEQNFKTKMERLNLIVAQLEDNQLDLEQSMQLFEEGLNLIKQCNLQLTQFDTKIQTLLNDFEDTKDE